MKEIPSKLLEPTQSSTPCFKFTSEAPQKGVILRD